MPYNEQFNSREFQLSDDGVTLTRVFSITWDVWNNDSTFASYYQIGSSLLADGEFSSNSYGLFVKYVVANWATTEYTKVTVLYATKESRAAKRKEPDQKGSWEESFDIGLSVETTSGDWPINTYNTGTNLWETTTWDDEWGVSGNDDKDKKSPDLTFHVPQFSYTITAYASTLYIKRVLSNVGLINSNLFMQDYFVFATGSGIVTDIPTDYNDRFQWLFASCPVRRVRFDCWEYQFNFKYNPRAGYGENWNQPYGLSVNIYNTFNFNDLLVGMTATDTLALPEQ